MDRWIDGFIDGDKQMPYEYWNKVIKISSFFKSSLSKNCATLVTVEWESETLWENPELFTRANFIKRTENERKKFLIHNFSCKTNIDVFFIFKLRIGDNTSNRPGLQDNLLPGLHVAEYQPSKLFSRFRACFLTQNFLCIPKIEDDT